MTTLGAFAARAAHMLAGGYSPIPLKPDTGLPAVKCWNELRNKAMSPRSIEGLLRKNAHLGLAVAGGFNGLVPIDIDTDDPDIVDAVTAVLPEPVVVRKGSKGFVAFYRGPTGTIAGRKFQTPRPNATVLVEVLSTGSVTIPPSIHRRTRQPYQWATKATLFNTRVGELSVIMPAHIKGLEKALTPWCPVMPQFVRPVVDDSILVSDRRRQAYACRVLGGEVSMLGGFTDGRNWGLYQSACKVGKYVHHKHITEAEVVNSLMGACVANGYQAKVGARQCLKTIKSGLKKSRGDALPALANRPRNAARAA
jgi:Bifunctional DNA primase/polymerase, N-terminal